VALLLRETGTGKGGRVELTNRWGVIATVREGRIVHTMIYRTPEEALDAAGLAGQTDDVGGAGDTSSSPA
jgi:hypothetical protein